MSLDFSHIAAWLYAHRVLLILVAVAFLFFLVAIIVVVVGIRKGKRGQLSFVSPDEIQPMEEANESQENPAPRVHREKFMVGDMASPWTQGVYERNSPEAKINQLLMAFALDEWGRIERVAHPEKVQPFNLDEVVKPCDTAAGVAVHGAFAALVLWHAGDERYRSMALKVASHAQMPQRQKDLICFLFQDVVGHALLVKNVPSLADWSNPEFACALALYTEPKITPEKWDEMSKILPTELHCVYELELAQKLPVRSIYKQASESHTYQEGLYRLNLQTLERYLNPKRWQKLLNSNKTEKFRRWLSEKKIQTEKEALFAVANPEIFEESDWDEETLAKIHSVLDKKNAHAWLFEGAPRPVLRYRLLYFKYFCITQQFNEAVRCFATLGVFRRERAQRLFYTRALFLSGMHDDAWSEIASLMAEHPRDAAVLNEAGIYAHKLHRYIEAAEIFSTARSFFPDDATLAYNEAVFTEKYSKLQVQEKWSEVKKLSGWDKPEPVIEPPVITA